MITNISRLQKQKSFTNNGNTRLLTPRIYAVFTIFSILFMGSMVSESRIYAQTNQTNFSDSTSIPSGFDSQDTTIDNTNDVKISDSSVNISANGEEQGSSNTVTQKSTSSAPDEDCLFDPSLSKCSPDEFGNCPDGFGMNEDEQCFPIHDRCPEGYHSHEDDESGRCIPDNVPCDPGYIMNPEFPSCDIKEYVCQDYPTLDGCKINDGQIKKNTKQNKPSPYESGYAHGCSDAKISDPSKQYINQPGKGPTYHTDQFMDGYYNGFNVCSEVDLQISKNKGSFKIIVEVTNQLSHDTYGGITVSVGNYPQNIFKSDYNIYFPAGQIVSKEFTFKSEDVPVGTEFEVNLDYGDDYNQYTFGKNTPPKKPEIVQFTIS